MARDSISPLGVALRERDRDRYQTALFAPGEHREALFALYAFNFEIARVREAVREPLAGRIRLQWWRDTLDEIYAGDTPRRHEVVTPLTEAIRRYALTQAHFTTLLDAREFDLADEPPADLAALDTYAENASGSLAALALEALGSRKEEEMRAGRAVGAAYALAGLLAAVPFHARQKRSYLPRDLARREGLEEWRTLFELKPSPPLTAIAKTVAARARDRLAQARALRPRVARAALPALLPAIVAERRLARLARAGNDPFDPSLARPDALQSAHLAWASWRGRY